MGETSTILGHKRDVTVFNYEFFKGEDITWKLK